MMLHTHHSLEMRDRSGRSRDPTHCSDLRSRLDTYLKKAVNDWRLAFRSVIVGEDVLGLSHYKLSTWSPADRLDKFALFARSSASRIFNESIGIRNTILSAYDRGSHIAHAELGAKNGHMKSTSVVFAAQAAHEIVGIVETSIQQMVRAVSAGIAGRRTPYQMYRSLLVVLNKVARARLILMSHNLITAAFNGGKLTAYETLGVNRVGVIAETIPATAKKPRRGFGDATVQILTAGDDNVCPICEDLEGAEFELRDAWGVLPIHPNCRCVWIPADEQI